MDTRLELLQRWLSHDLDIKVKRIEPASADASFRRYFRVTTQDNVYIAMDAPPEKESIATFVQADHALVALGVHAPTIHYQETELGFLLLEDLGMRTYLDELNENPDVLYDQALTALITLQTGNNTTGFQPPEYDGTKLEQEMDLFLEWFITHHLRYELSDPQILVWTETKQLLVNECLAQPQVWVHRDYHSRNLMITPDRSPGVIDFQDIVVGPIGYDLASIFKDCYIEWPRERQIQWLELFRTKSASKLSLDELIRYFDFAGLQRHLKVLGIFCRLNYRDKKTQYLDDLPLVAKYVLEVIDLYPELSAFKTAFAKMINSL